MDKKEKSELYFPRVLIIGYFNQKMPVGITTKNIFQNWPQSEIAVASFGKLEELYSPICRYYYCLGSKEIKYRFPFNLINKVNPSKAHDIKSFKILDNAIINKKNP